MQCVELGDGDCGGAPVEARGIRGSRRKSADQQRSVPVSNTHQTLPPICSVSSSVTVTAAALLSPLVDYADLDGNLLISNDPFHGVRVVNGKLVLPSKPGLG